MKHLEFSLLWAAYNNVEQDHAQIEMKKLGITYQHSTPQSMLDCWQFWNCENVPNELPPFLTEIERSPVDFIGHGLSKEDAEKINNYEMDKRKR